jgi:hypothetical protein
MEVDVMFLITTRMWFPPHIKKVQHSSLQKICINTPSPSPLVETLMDRKGLNVSKKIGTGQNSLNMAFMWFINAKFYILFYMSWWMFHNIFLSYKVEHFLIAHMLITLPIVKWSWPLHVKITTTNCMILYAVPGAIDPDFPGKTSLIEAYYGFLSVCPN